MGTVQVGRTASRRVLGSLNDLMFQLQVRLDAHPERSLVEHSLRLAETPCKLIGHASPDRATRALFASSAILAKIGNSGP